MLFTTAHRVVDLTDLASELEVAERWEEITGRAGEGLVVKPLTFTAKRRAKRSLALREFALAVAGLERFVRKEPLRRVHECVFGG